MARSEYSRLRSIAQRRIDRLQERGLASQGIRFPTVKELKSESQKEKAMADVLQFLGSCTNVKEARKENLYIEKSPRGSAPKVLTPEERRQEEQRQKRRESRQRRKDALASLTKEQRSMVKIATALGLRLSNAQLPVYAEYMSYRLSQAGDSTRYLVARYTEDFASIMKNKEHNLSDIVGDFQRFISDRNDLVSEFSNMSGSSEDRIMSIWDKYIES